MNAKLSSLIRSRRFWASVAALAAVVGEQFGVSTGVTQEVVLLIAAWVIGDSLRRTE